MKRIFQKLEIPEHDKSTSITAKEAEYIHDFIIKNNINKTLEVGFAYGCSTAHIIAATHKQHYVIDPYQDSFLNLGLKNLAKLGLDKYLLYKNDFSHNVLPQLLKESVSIDFAFIDGGHLFDEIFIDFFYIDLLLTQNGFVVFHDSWMRSTQHVISWIKNNKKNYKILRTPIKNLIIVQKKGVYKRAWHHFSGFGTYKSFISHYLFYLKIAIKDIKQSFKLG